MILSKFIKTIESYGMLSPRDKVVVAVSGGSDSVGLLHLLMELKKFNLSLVVAHLNHKLRGIESDRDAEFVEKVVRDTDFQFEYKEVDTEKYKRKNKLSMEDAGRRLRYEFFNEVLEKYNANKIATAHTLDDQAETVLMRIIRGSGTLGLSGIPPISNNIIRPLINISRSEIREYLKSKHFNWVEDSSNVSREFRRNKIRSELMPLLTEYNPSIQDTLARSAEILRIESDYTRSEVEKIFDKIISKKSIGLIGKIKKYLKIQKALRLGIIRKCVEELKGDLHGISAKHLLSIDRVLSSDSSSAEIDLPGNLFFAKGYKVFCITNKENLEKDYTYVIENEGKWRFSPILTVELNYSDDNSSWGDERVGHFSLKKVRFPIKIRNFRPGDRFVPLGMRRFKKIKDFFIDEKVPRFVRKNIPILETKDGIIWIGGLRIDNRFKVEENEKEFLKIKIKGSDFDLLSYFQDI